MNEQAQQVLSEMLQRALNGVDAAVEFSQAQIPELIQELLMWHAIKSGISMTLSIAAFMCAYYVASRYWIIVRNECKKHILKQDDGLMIGAPIIGGLGTIILMTLGFVFFSIKWLQIIIAPKLYLVEYAASLVK